MDKKEQLPKEMFLPMEQTHKIHSNSCFHLLVQQQLGLPPLNLCSISKEPNKLVVEAKRD